MFSYRSRPSVVGVDNHWKSLWKIRATGKNEIHVPVVKKVVIRGATV